MRAEMRKTDLRTRRRRWRGRTAGLGRSSDPEGARLGAGDGRDIAAALAPRDRIARGRQPIRLRYLSGRRIEGAGNGDGKADSREYTFS